MQSTLFSLSRRIEKFGLARLYVFMALFFGVILVFLLPPYQVPDGMAHAFRGYQISTGTMLSPVEKHVLYGIERNAFMVDMPGSLAVRDFFDIWHKKYSQEDVTGFLAVPLRPEVTFRMDIPNTGAYAPVAYAPQALAAFAARSLGASAGAMFYAMRLDALLFTVFCFWLSMRLLPEKQLFLFLFGMMPMVLTQGISESADAVVNGVCVLMTAWLLSLRREPSTLSWQKLLLLLTGAVLLGLLKQIYAAILLLYFLLPVEKLGGRKCFWLFGLLLLAAALGASAVWLRLAVITPGAELNFFPGSDTVLQLKWVLAQPMQYLHVMGRTIGAQAGDWYEYFIGKLGWLVIKLPWEFITGYGICLLLAGLFGDLHLSIRQRLYLLVVFMIIAAAVITSQYLNWTVVGADLIEGVQGRYFIPAALMVFSALSVFQRLRQECLIAVLAGTASGFFVLWAVYMFFY